MTLEKMQELMQTRMAYYDQHLSDETAIAQLRVYAVSLGDVPDEIAEIAFYTALNKCRYPSQFLVDWTDAIRDIQRKQLPSDAALWSETMTAAHNIADCFAVYQNGGYAGEDRKERLEAARHEFERLPIAVQHWAGSPHGLCDLVNSNTKSELNKFVRPGFNKMLAGASLCELQPGTDSFLESGPSVPQISSDSH